MRDNKNKEIPLYNVTTKEVQNMYNFVYMFVLDLRSRKGATTNPRYKSAIESPGWAAAEIIYMCLYGYTKKIKFSKRLTYYRWNNAPKSLEARAIVLLGKEGKEFKNALENNGITIDSTSDDSKIPFSVDSPIITSTAALTAAGFPDDAAIQRRMQRYIEDFDLHSAIDMDLLKNLIVTQVLIEAEHSQLLMHRSTGIDLRQLTMQVDTYTKLLGLSKKDRLDYGAEKKKGTVAELVGVYEDTKRKYVEIEIEFLQVELEMLLHKYERRNPDGDREISESEFRIVSGGYSVEEAREYLGKKLKDVRHE